MSEEEEVLGEIKIEGCTYKVTQNRSEPDVVRLEGVSCDLRKDLEKANKIVDVLFGGKEVRYKAPKLVKAETSGDQGIRA